MPTPLRPRFWFVVSLGALTAVVAVATLVSREWIELVFRVDPDRGDGSLEWLIVVGALAVTVLSAVLARLEWQRTVRVIAVDPLRR